ncbi:MAG: hypothetical protein ABWY18_13025 [Tardiphaga sp.]
MTVALPQRVAGHRPDARGSMRLRSQLGTVVCVSLPLKVRGRQHRISEAA